MYESKTIDENAIYFNLTISSSKIKFLPLDVKLLKILYPIIFSEYTTKFTSDFTLTLTFDTQYIYIENIIYKIKKILNKNIEILLDYFVKIFIINYIYNFYK